MRGVRRVQDVASCAPSRLRLLRFQRFAIILLTFGVAVYSVVFRALSAFTFSAFTFRAFGLRKRPHLRFQESGIELPWDTAALQSRGMGRAGRDALRSLVKVKHGSGPIFSVAGREGRDVAEFG